MALPAPGETTEGSGIDVHEEDTIEEEESFLFQNLADSLDSIADD